MIRSQLQDYCGDDPTWGFVAQLGAEQFTGVVQLGSATRVLLYVDEGAVYFAEREGDAPVQSRLVVRGALTPAQLARGGVFADGTVSLARLFTRDSSIDRHEVETALERLTQEVLDEVGPAPVGSLVITPLRHHDSGIHEWARRIQPPVVRTAPQMVAPVRPIPSVVPLTIEGLTVAQPAAVTPPAPPVAPVAPLAIPTSPPVESPFSAPPVAAMAASLPAPLPAPTPAVSEADTTVDADTTDDIETDDTGSASDATEQPSAPPTDRYTPADFSGIELPKLATRVMSVAEFTAHSEVTGDDAQPAVGDRFSPTDFSGMELPKLATKVMSVSELAAKLAEPEPEPAIEAEPVVDEATSVATGFAFDSGPVPAIDAAPMPGLPTLHMGPTSAPTPTDGGHVTVQTSDHDHDHDTLTSVDAEQEHEDEDDHDRVVEPIATWASPSQNLAAVEIWEMVDSLLAEESDDSDLVSAGGPTDHKGGRWRRGRKG